MSHSYRLTIILAIVLAGIGAYIYYVDVPASEQAIEVKEAARELLPLDDRRITHFTMKTAQDSLVFSRDEQGRWLITEPLVAPADGREVRKILRALTLGTIERVIQEQAADLEQYGLDPPHMTVTLTDGQQTMTLDLGNPGPFSSSLYVRKVSDNSVVLTTLNVLSFAKKNLYTFRLKDVLFFNHASVEHLEIHSPDQDMVLHRVPGVHGMSPNWRFERPIVGPADKTTVGVLLMALEDLNAQAFIDSPEDKQELLATLGAPKATAIIKTANRTHPVSFYQQDDTTYAKTSDDKPLYRIPAKIVTDLTQGLFSMRDKRLLGIAPEDVAIVRIQTSTESYGLIHQNDVWLWEEDPATPIDQKAVNLLVSRLAGLPAEHRVSEQESQLTRYGLDHPKFLVVATDTRGKERGRLLLGEAKRGLVYATGAGLPGISQARSTILTQIPSIKELVEQPASH
ncbi:MAG: DUF4340 domain-containing protein [Nitrospirales bacterium]|nr:DUF4340 domain-containing protein [Nitrospira sp.]MDR4499872.1 DUF4340 domain-containing protein [Nitrospirales bacterium]